MEVSGSCLITNCVSIYDELVLSQQRGRRSLHPRQRHQTTSQSQQGFLPQSGLDSQSSPTDPISLHPTHHAQTVGILSPAGPLPLQTHPLTARPKRCVANTHLAAEGRSVAGGQLTGPAVIIAAANVPAEGVRVAVASGGDQPLLLTASDPS
jgi:hypothetical protein